MGLVFGKGVATFAGYTFNATISTAVSNYNVRTAATAAGWNGTDPLKATITVSSAGVISSTSSAGYGFDTDLSFPAGSTLALINNGKIYGRGGDGAGGQDAYQKGFRTYPAADGGTALRAQFAITITNNGSLIGGGGGGGGGAAGGNDVDSGGGGGGGAGIDAGAGGYGGNGKDYEGSDGASGTATAGGAGGDGGGGGGGTGGTGGGPGLAGGNAVTNGGAAGNATLGNSNITWSATGTRTGPIN